MIRIGEYNLLKASRHSKIGLFLADEEGEEVLLPFKHIPENIELGDEIKAFVYLDNQQRPIATSMHPRAVVGEFGFLQVRQVTDHGAFLYWGVEKDIFVPFQQQEKRMKEGKWYWVRIYIDNVTGRITGSSRLKQFIEKHGVDLEPGQKVSLSIIQEEPLGYRVIVDHLYWGMLFRNELFKRAEIGQQVEGYVKGITEDFKVDATLEQPGYGRIQGEAERILLHLKANNGFLDLTDKSDPEEIKSRLRMSKKTFKKAIGGLYKDKVIQLEEDGIRLNSQ